MEYHLIVSFIPYRRMLQHRISDDCLDIIEEFYLSLFRQETVIEIKLLYKNYNSLCGHFYIGPLNYLIDIKNSAISEHVRNIIICRYIVYDYDLAFRHYGCGKERQVAKHFIKRKDQCIAKMPIWKEIRASRRIPDN